MKNIIVLSFLFLMLLFNKSNGQVVSSSTTSQKTDTLKFELTTTIPGHYTYFNVDVFNNIYVINTKNQLKKINEKGDSVGIYNDMKKYGAVSNIDVSNPFKIAIFYNAYKYIVTLDQLLTFRNVISLRSKDFFNVSALATSYDNNYWIFDERDFKLKKIDDKGQTIIETGDLRIVAAQTIHPKTIVESNNQVYLYDEQKGFFIFDFYGTYKNNIPFLNWKSVSLYNNKLIGFDADKIYNYELNSFNLQEAKLPDFIHGYQSLKLSGNRLYVLKDEGIFIYKIY